ncbi:MAG: tetratricopeptide repeat protein [Acidobacteria bacterium]|nr:tetratricopeptide repeat protein [Acidobacteriota bacterium]
MRRRLNRNHRRWIESGSVTLSVLLIAGTSWLWFRDTSPDDPGVASAAASRRMDLIALAAFDPPAYPSDSGPWLPPDARKIVDEAQTAYERKDYLRSSALLQQASGTAPSSARIRLYLAISYLLTSDTAAAIHELRTTIRLGDPAYLQSAHFYLAKAFLRQRDPADAVEELTAAIKLGGPLTEPARRLRSRVQAALM